MLTAIYMITIGVVGVFVGMIIESVIENVRIEDSENMYDTVDIIEIDGTDNQDNYFELF